MIHLIHACAIVQAGSGSTLIDVQVTMVPLKSRHTEALVAINPIFTDGSVLTGLRLALIDVLLTVAALVPSSTLALVPSVWDIHASATILARLF